MRYLTVHPSATIRIDRSNISRILTLVLVFAALSTGSAQAQDVIERGYGPPHLVAARQDSLLAVALTASDRQARVVAILGIASPGRAWHSANGSEAGPAPIHYPGTVARLERLYRAGGRLERETVVTSLMNQAERAEAIRLLSEVARSREMGLDLPLAPMAISALSRMGDQGAAALRALHVESDSLPFIRRQLEELARTGYRRPPGGHRTS